jgi:hypothetical protein
VTVAGNGSPSVGIDRGRGYQSSGSGRADVYDLDFAAYLLLRNVPLAEATRSGREFTFVFQDPEGLIAKLSVEYMNSESARFADAVRRLKKVVFSQPGSRGV